MTDTTTVYMLLAVAGGLLGFSLISLYKDGPNAVSIVLMALPAVISWLISNLYVDGTLTSTTKFLTSNDSIMTMDTVVRDPAASLIFQVIGIVLIFASLLQLYGYFTQAHVLDELEQGDEE